MTRVSHPITTAIVVALTGPVPPDLLGRLARFVEEAGPQGEVVLVDASGGSWASEVPGVRVLRRPAGRLAPLLWRDGIVATDAPLVALTTASMTPRTGWLGSLRALLDITGAAGVGGPIEPGSTMSLTDRAVALLRYSRYFPPLPDQAEVEPPGDNALYRRDPLMEVESCWLEGFWEVAVHQALRARGDSLAMDRSAVVTYQGGARLLSMIAQRYRHARRFGLDRSQGLGGLARLARVLAAPLVLPLLCLRIARNLRAGNRSIFPWLTAVPSLLVLASSWAIGEAVGIARGGMATSADFKLVSSKKLG